MPRIPILSDQSVIIADTLTRQGSAALIVLKAADATPVFWSANRGDLDGNLDGGNNPGGGIPIFQTDPPLVLLAVRAQLWGRAPSATKLYVELMEVNLQTYLGALQTPGIQPTPITKPVGPLPIDFEGWWNGRRHG